MESKNYRYINLEFKRGICILNFNRPDKKNALSSDMRSEIIDALTFLKKKKELEPLFFMEGRNSFPLDLIETKFKKSYKVKAIMKNS